tara:strand:+ start:198 stop:1121 length:924 start_codon:yes stop_codon:yes gene_type:complete
MKKKLELNENNAGFISGVITQLTGNYFLPRVNTPNRNLQYAYAFDDIAYVDENVDGQNHKDLVISSVKEDGGSEIKEYIIARKLGLFSNSTQNGVDAYSITYNNKSGKFVLDNTVELKSESERVNKKLKSGFNKLSGKFSISSKLIKDPTTVDEWIAKNDKITVSGWWKGRVAYILSFNTKASGVPAHIYLRLSEGAKVGNGGISFSNTHFINTPGLQVDYINPELCTNEFITKPVLDKLLGSTTKKVKSTVRRRGTKSKSRLEVFPDVVQLLRKKGFTASMIADRTGVSKKTVYRVKQDLNQLQLV